MEKPKTIDNEIFTSILAESWDAATSASPEQWSEANRALGQCAVTACVVQDYMGGDIFNTTATLPDGSTNSHYYNSIASKEEDYTRSQFPDATTYSAGVPKTVGRDGTEYGSTREYILSFPIVAGRYHVLKARVDDRIKRAMLSS